MDILPHKAGLMVCKVEDIKAGRMEQEHWHALVMTDSKYSDHKMGMSTTKIRKQIP